MLTRRRFFDIIYVDEKSTQKEGEKMTNSEELKKIIKNSGLSKEYIADKLGICVYSLHKKINNQTEFKSGEIKILSDILNLDSNERDYIFFGILADC